MIEPLTLMSHDDVVLLADAVKMLAVAVLAHGLLNAILRK